MSAAVTCPYCNTFVGAAAGPRLTCPRCGESFPHRGAADAAPGPHDPHRNGHATVQPPPGRSWSNQQIALGVLGIMVAMAAIGLAWALYTVPWRRHNDHRTQPTTPTPVVRSVPPAELSGLGYLPAGTNLVAAIHVADAWRTPAGKAFLDRAELAGSGLQMADVEKMVGLRRDDIDHVVFGLRLVDRELPRVVLIVRTRQPYDPRMVREALKASRPRDIGKKEVYAFNLDKPRLSALLWQAAPDALVVGISREDIEAVPNGPGAGLQQLPEPLQAFLRERLGGPAQAWLAGHAENWDALRLLARAALSDENARLLGSIQTFGLRLRLDAGVDLRGAVHCRTADAAQALEQALTPALTKESNLFHVLGTGPEGAQVADGLVKSLQIRQQDAWVTLTAAAPAPKDPH